LPISPGAATNNGMWYSVVFSLALIGAMTPFWLGILPPLNARWVLRFRNGGCSHRGAALPSHVKSSVAEILQATGVKRGFIAMTPDSRVKFSWQIPKAIHQRLRNVVLNP
jgi:hypothetical protein